MASNAEAYLSGETGRVQSTAVVGLHPAALCPILLQTSGIGRLSTRAVPFQQDG